MPARSGSDILAGRAAAVSSLTVEGGAIRQPKEREACFGSFNTPDPRGSLAAAIFVPARAVPQYGKPPDPAITSRSSGRQVRSGCFPHRVA